MTGCALLVGVLGCATCYGDPNSALTHGMNMGILTLLGVTGAVLGGFMAMIVRLAVRARRAGAHRQGVGRP
jgi:hypothetical protein